MTRTRWLYAGRCAEPELPARATGIGRDTGVIPAWKRGGTGPWESWWWKKGSRSRIAARPPTVRVAMFTTTIQPRAHTGVRSTRRGAPRLALVCISRPGLGHTPGARIGTGPDRDPAGHRRSSGTERRLRDVRRRRLREGHTHEGHRTARRQGRRRMVAPLSAMGAGPGLLRSHGVRTPERARYQVGIAVTNAP